MADTATPKHDVPTDIPPRPRRWVPLSLRIFAALLVILGGGSLWIGFPAFRQYAAIREIQRLRGTANFRRVGPQWLRDVVGNQLMQGLDEVIDVDLRRTAANDHTLDHLKGLASLEWVDLGSTDVTDAGLAHLKELTNLQSLSLRNTAVTDAGLGSLRGLTKLKSLDLHNTKVNYEAAFELKQALPELQIGLLL
jgi:hypothetical protein